MKASHLARLIAPLLVAGLLTVSRSRAGDAPASEAPTPTHLDEARTHFGRGVKFYKDADYRSALVEFQEAYRVAPNARLLFNIGQTYDELQDFAGAVKAFRAYLIEGGDSVTKARRATVEADLRRLEAHVATLEITVSEPGADVVAEGDRRIDLGKSPLAPSVLLNGGQWKLVATKPGFERAEERVTVAGGDTKKIALVVVRTPVAPVALVIAPQAVMPPTPQPRRRSMTPVWIGLAVTGGLAAVAGVTGALTLGAKSTYDQELGRLPGNADAVATARTHERTLALVTDVLSGAAIVSAAVTVVLYVGASGGASRAAASPSASSPKITPYVGLTSIGAVGSF